jgi:hypothetical protein
MDENPYRSPLARSEHSTPRPSVRRRGLDDPRITAVLAGFGAAALVFVILWAHVGDATRLLAAAIVGVGVTALVGRFNRSRS